MCERGPQPEIALRSRELNRDLLAGARAEPISQFPGSPIEREPVVGERIPGLGRCALQAEAQRRS